MCWFIIFIQHTFKLSWLCYASPHILTWYIILSSHYRTPPGAKKNTKHNQSAMRRNIHFICLFIHCNKLSCIHLNSDAMYYSDFGVFEVRIIFTYIFFLKCKHGAGRDDSVRKGTWWSRQAWWSEFKSPGPIYRSKVWASPIWAIPIPENERWRCYLWVHRSVSPANPEAKIPASNKEEKARTSIGRVPTSTCVLQTPHMLTDALKYTQMEKKKSIRCLWG